MTQRWKKRPLPHESVSNPLRGTGFNSAPCTGTSMGEGYSVRCEVPWIGWLESADRAQNRQTRALCLGEALCPETSRPAFAELEEYIRTNAQQSLRKSRTRSSRIYVRINTASLSGNGPRDFCYRSTTHFSPLWCPTGFSNLENRNVAPTTFTPLKRTSILYIYIYIWKGLLN